MNAISSTEKFIQVGFNENEALKIKELVASHEPGIYIVSGLATGVTSMLKAVLESIIANETTDEDPPEYAIYGATSLPVVREDPDAFHTAIARAMCMRPSVMIIASIEDQNQAARAVEAAHSGHRVWSTVISDQSISKSEAIDYLAGLGVPRNLVRGIIGHK